jgi:hypothetical protein
VFTKHGELSLDLSDETFQGLGLVVVAHIDEYFLDDMIAVEVHAALNNIVALVEFSEHLFSFPVIEGLKSGLNHSAAMLMIGKFKNLAFDVIINNIMIALILGCVLLNSLNHIIPILIFDKAVKINVWVLEQLVIKPLLLMHVDIKL